MGRTNHAIPIEVAEQQNHNPSTVFHPTANVYQHGEKTDPAFFDPADQTDADGNPIPWEKIVADYAEEQNRVGRPSAYNRLFHPRMAYLLTAKTGAEMTTLAELFGIHAGTFTNWRWKYPEFNAAIKAGWDEFAISTAEKALLNRAIGYRTEDIEYQRVPIFDTVMDAYNRPHKVVIGYEQVETRRTQRSIAADPTCLMFLLQNRHGDRWRNVRKVEATLRTEHSTTHQHAHLHLGTNPSTDLSPRDLLPSLTDAQLAILHQAACALRLARAEPEQETGLEGVGAVIDCTEHSSSAQQQEHDDGEGEG